MPEKLIHDAGTVRIGAENYRLAQTEEMQAWGISYESEPPWLEGEPPMLSIPQSTWHMGGFKSREGMEGTTEYGQDTDCRWPNRILPGPLITPSTLSGGGIPRGFFEALGYLWVLHGNYVSRINPADDVVTQSKNLADLAVDGARWETDIGLVTTVAAANNIWKVTAIGAPDTWVQGTADNCYRLAPGINRLFVVSKTGLLSNVGTGLDPLDGANYADEVQCGSKVNPPTSIVAFEKTVIVGKPEGPYGVSDEGIGVPLLDRLAYHADNCRGMKIISPFAFVPHNRGLLRFTPGFADSVGLERELLNESEVRGRVTALAVDGPWVYKAIELEDESANYVVVGREKRSGEPGFGPYIWDTLCYLPPADAVPGSYTIKVALAADDGRLYKAGATYAAARASTALVSADATIMGQRAAGFYIDRTYHRFNLASLVGLTYTACKLQVYLTGKFANAGVIQVRKYVWSDGGLIAADWRAPPSADPLLGAIDWTALPAAPGWFEITLDPAQIPATGYLEIYLISSLDDDDPGIAPTGYQHIEIEGFEGVGTNEPRLVFTTLASPAAITAMYVSHLWSPPRLWLGRAYGTGSGIYHVKLPASAGPPRSGKDYWFAPSGKRWTPKYRFGDWNSKAFPKVKVAGKNLSALRYWDIYYSVDGGAFSNLDKGGQAMRIDSDSPGTFQLPDTAVGREIQYRFDYTGIMGLYGGEIIYFEPFGVPQAQKIPIIRCAVYCAAGIRHDSGRDPRTALQQYSDLETLSESATAVATYGPWGDNVSAWVKRVKLVQVIQEGVSEPELLVEVILQRRE